MKPSTVALTLGGVALTALSALAVSEKLKVTSYVVYTDKIQKPIRLLHISDLHSSAFGRDQSELIAVTSQISPDAILMTGDIADNRVPNTNAYAYTRYIGKRYPCFYVSGNHEFYTGHAGKIKRIFSHHGIAVLEGTSEILSVKGEALTVCGVDDPYGCPDNTMRFWEEQLADCNACIDKSRYSILLTHRPEIVDYYSETDFDLILAGHAHGGQVIVPGIMNGLYAPHQGFLPPYAGGRFELSSNQTLIVSRGLSKYVKPRIFNRPEIVVITLLPKA